MTTSTELPDFAMGKTVTGVQRSGIEDKPNDMLTGEVNASVRAVALYLKRAEDRLSKPIRVVILVTQLSLNTSSLEKKKVTDVS